MTSDAVLRRVRALTLPSVLFISGLAGHVAAGGVTPAASVLVPLFVLTVLAVAPFAGAPISPARVMALLVGGQGLLHVALQLLGGTAVGHDNCGWRGHMVPTAASSAAGSHVMMHHGAAASHGSVMSLMSDGHLVMLLAHLAAAVVVGVWLAAGERACWTLLALTARPVVDAWRTVTAVARRRVGAVVVTVHGFSLAGACRVRSVTRYGSLVSSRAAARPALRRLNLTLYAAVSTV